MQIVSEASREPEEYILAAIWIKINKYYISNFHGSGYHRNIYIKICKPKA